MTPSDLDHMFCHDGAYVLSDPRFPSATSVVIVMGSEHNEQGQCTTEGRMFMLEPKCELSKNPAHWAGIGTHLVAGPLSVQTIAAANDELDMLHHDLGTLLDVAERCRPMLPAYFELVNGIGRQDEALKAKQVMSDIDALLEARKRCTEMLEPQIPQAQP